MKYSIMLRGFGHILNGFIKKEEHDKTVRKEILKEYQRILTHAKDIGAKNELLSSYALAAYFIAMNRCRTCSPEENIKLLGDGLCGCKLTRMFLGSAEAYLDEKALPRRMAWAERLHQHQYENDWDLNVLPGNDEYELGYDYLECGVCKLCRDEGCFELAKYLCRLDFQLVEVIGVRLTRTTTLAEGGDKCDFRFHAMK